MSETTKRKASRREFLAGAGGAAAVSAVTGVSLPHVHSQESNTIQVALVGCGGRGTGAASNALSVKNGMIKIVAMADIFESKLKRSFGHLEKKFRAQYDVPNDRKFLGFDAYKKAMSCLKKGDVVILTTPPAFRWVMFKYAIEKGLNVFMEKPVTVDGPTTKRMIALSKEADKKNLKVGVGLMIRHCRGRQELAKRVQDGEIGDIIAMRGYRMGGGGGLCGPKPADMSHLRYQIQRFHSFLWASGGVYNDFYIHQIDEASMIKGAWPVSAHAVGGRHYRGNLVDQNLDSYGVEYVYPDGTRYFYYGRQMPKCHNEFATYAHGTKGTCIISTRAHVPGKVRTFKGHHFTKEEQLWAYPQPEKNPYQLEWDDLIDAIRKDKPYNEAERGAIGSMVTSMGRMAAHLGRHVTYDEILNCKHEFAPDVDKMTENSPPPVPPDKDGKYPVPEPGRKKTEY